MSLNNAECLALLDALAAKLAAAERQLARIREALPPAKAGWATLYVDYSEELRAALRAYEACWEGDK